MRGFVIILLIVLVFSLLLLRPSLPLPFPRLRESRGPPKSPKWKKINREKDLWAPHAAVPLYTEWEERSRNGTCQPPPGTPRRCCLGSGSAGGNVKYDGFWTSCTRAPYDAFEPIQASLPLWILHNKTITFTGDSIMYQNVVAFECAWLARGWTTVFQERRSRKKHEGWRFGVGTIEEFRIQKGPYRVNVRFFLQYRPYSDGREWDEILQTDVLFLNFGVHWRNPSMAKAYRRAMSDVFSRLNQTIVIWRETTAQHFDHDVHGDFSPGMNEIPCVSRSRLAGWRRKIITNVSRFSVPTAPLDSCDSFFIPFLNQSDHYDLHLSAFSGCNTHFCHTPYFWEPVWQSLTRILYHLHRKCSFSMKST